MHDGAITFHEFGKNDAYTPERQMLFHLFLHLAETLAEKEEYWRRRGLKEKKNKHKKKKKTTNKTTKKKKASSSQDDPLDDEADSMGAKQTQEKKELSLEDSEEEEEEEKGKESDQDSGDESSSSQAIESDCDNMRGGGDNNRADGRDSTDSVVQLFLESVRRQEPKTSQEGQSDEYTDYRFWLIVKATDLTVKLDPNLAMERIVGDAIKENSRGLSRVNSSVGSTASASSSRIVYAWEQHKKIVSKAHLGQLLDLYANQEHASASKDTLRLEISDTQSPICASQLFSLMWAFKATDARQDHGAVRVQSIWNWTEYVTSAPSNTKTLCFPLRKYVYRVAQEEIRTDLLYNKILPEVQKHTVNQLLRSLPLILDENDSAEIIEQEDYAQEDPMDVSQNARDSPTYDRDDAKEVKQLLQSHRSSTDSDSAESIPRTRSDMLEALSESCGISNYNAHDIKAFRRGELLLQRNKIVDLLLRSSMSLVHHLGSPYVPIASVSDRNLTYLRSSMINRATNKYWSGLDHPDIVARKLYLLNQMAVIKEYKQRCRNPHTGGGLSPSGSKIIEYVETEKLYERPDVRRRKTDPSLSCFANEECRRYDLLEHVYFVNNAHRMASLVEKNSLDAYCVAFQRIHQNTILHSDKGCLSKSFIWQLLMRHWRMPNTTECITYETAKSKATDEVNMNDSITIYDEIEQALLDKNGTSDSDKERTLKQLLCMNKIIVRTLVMGEDGKRTTKLTYAEWISVFFGSTNMDIACVSEAMARRWHFINMDETPGIYRAIVEMDLISQIMSDSEKIYRKKIDREFHLMQALVFELEKLISMKALADVTMHVAVVILLYISNELMFEGYPEPNASTFERIRVLARMNTIYDAINMTFFSEGARYRDAPILIDHFQALDRKLYCTVQHVVSALGELLDLLIDPTEIVIRKALKIIFERRELSGTNPYQSKMVVTENPDGSFTKNWIPVPTYARLALQCGGRSLRPLAAKIYSTIQTMDRTDGGNQPSRTVIVKTLKSWMQRQFNAHEYTRAVDSEMGEKLTPKPGEKHMMEIASKNDKAFFVHIAFIHPEHALCSPAETIEKILQKMLSSKYQMEQRLVFTPNRTVHHVRDIISIPAPQPHAPYLCLPLVARITDLEKTMLAGIDQYTNKYRESDHVIIDTDLDSYGLRERNLLLFITREAIDPKSLVSNPIDFVNDVEHVCEHLSAMELQDGVFSEDSRSSISTPSLSAASSSSDERAASRVDVYDDKVGYFLGDNLDHIFTEDMHSIDQLGPESLQKIYDGLDVYDADSDNRDDYDFRVEEYFLATHPETGKRMYHWDALAQPWTVEQMDLGPLTPSDVKPFRYLNMETPGARACTSLQLEQYKRTLDETNRIAYKLICTHPWMMNDLENRKFYVNQPERWGCYPRDIVDRAKETRIARWERVRSLNLTEEDILEKMKEGDVACANTEYTMIASHFDREEGTLSRDPTQVDCILGSVDTRNKIPTLSFSSPALSHTNDPPGGAGAQDSHFPATAERRGNEKKKRFMSLDMGNFSSSPKKKKKEDLVRQIYNPFRL